ncbi:2-amino-3,7-dideoxy-D-threo-hept-6-ulosonate synthase [Methanosarcina thermophila]|jgi:fructose-bisphosphate aldolase/2-amino-3,7-dideoxy-D-threo-hept-6-ulosonate synthase|uniref:2-amino-3,7-dideoxy-D-threo-hept-6-ulosonate synthase n=4 Tax=Methanosarcina thermophila TaxID=2210 RepID=A0A1I6YQL2_METTE|nr:2-amino-3,7-dideoxy-D-threo-hept-6-ulosonate synthase [Methanosarcina thermophila TM-1]AKB15456.1 2-amino-3,7-dideoxy-D-threo-hept-6-ulosonate synthase [Methanosarcina thermophila CHTI-55]BAW28941.1 2-amino-3,7-dideoxy-D-threo-hept-6-ulosonate synthase [Methanosarcina thermophila]GLI14593.1 fructose-bisphosphate aldolase [Methanosarcina thermophila MST-A1]SFT52704.1 2-amino-3,7-dideoxy-D-threo-hept-6-ulosonate synthase [Methanosarcina thermophila]
MIEIFRKYVDKYILSDLQYNSMSTIGKSIRMERIFNRNTGNTIIVPMDHGVSLGPIEGLRNLQEAVNKVAEGGANAVLGHMGLAKHGHRGYGRDVGLIIHLSASTSLSSDPNHKVLVTKVEEAIKVGADGVSVHINIGAEDEYEMLQGLGYVARKCDKWGMPLLAMMYPRGRKVHSEYDVDVVKHAARIGAELGADIIKTNYTGSPETFKEVVEGCPVPVIIAGGPKMNSEQELLEMIEGSLEAGGRGVAIGRNVFQAQDPTGLVRKIAKIVHEGVSVEELSKSGR